MKSATKPTPGAAPVYEGEFEEMPGGGGMVLASSTQLRTQYTTAQIVQRERTIKSVVKRVEDECEMAGDDVYYSWTQGGKLIEGISIDGAMIMLRNYGNCTAEAQVVKEGPDFWVFDAVFIDLETGVTMSRQFRQRKSEAHQSSGKNKDADRLLDIAFQIGQSKAIRNVIVNAMPVWLKDKAMAKAKQAADGKYADIPMWVEKSLAAYGKLKPRAITKEDLEKKLGGKPTDLWTSGDIQLLLALHRGILARETNVDAEFPLPEAATPPPATNGNAPPKSEEKPKAEAPSQPKAVEKPKDEETPPTPKDPVDPAKPMNLFGGEKKDEKKE